MTVGFNGVFPILPTPFRPDESIDLASYARMVSFMRQLGVDGITILGVLGEANRLTDTERDAIIQTAIEAAGELTVVVGTSHSGTHASIQLGEMAASHGASAVMVTPHHEAVHNEQRIFEHLSAICRSSTLPVVLQDHPGSTGVHMSLALVQRLLESEQNIACVKQEALPSPQRIQALRSFTDVPILTGLGALYGAFELSAGGNGFMTGFAFPEILQAMHRAQIDGDENRLWSMYREYLPLIVFEQQPGVAVRKEIFRRRGLIDHGHVRGPAAGLNPLAKDQLDQLVSRVFATTNITEPLSL